MTPQEKILWEELRRHNIKGFKFKRQVPIGDYIVDFYCHAHRLIIELDGRIHMRQKEYDRLRQEILEQKEFTVLRFTNDQVDHELQKVLKTITDYISPSPARRGVGER